MAKKLETKKRVGPGGIRYTLTERDGTYHMRFTNPRTGKQRREPTKTALVSEAESFADQYLQTYIVDANDPSKTTVGDIMKAYIAKQKPRNRREVQRMWDNRMAEIFAGVQANDVRTTDIRQYKLHCAGEKIGTGLFAGIKPYPTKLSTGTINRDLANLRAAFRYAFKGGEISKVPHFEIDDNRMARRQGFLTQAQFDQIMTCQMPVWLRALLHVLYAVGIRFTEAASITVGQCDFVGRIIRLERTKNGEPRNPPMTAQMFYLLKTLAEGKSASDPIIGAPVIWTCHDYWNDLIEISGLEQHFLMHDMRRSAVRNMINRGVSEKQAMLISGHLTRHIIDAYNIVDERNMRKAAELIDAGAEEERAELERLYALDQPAKNQKEVQ